MRKKNDIFFNHSFLQSQRRDRVKGSLMSKFVLGVLIRYNADYNTDPQKSSS